MRMMASMTGIYGGMQNVKDKSYKKGQRIMGKNSGEKITRRPT